RIFWVFMKSELSIAGNSLRSLHCEHWTMMLLQDSFHILRARRVPQLPHSKFRFPCPWKKIEGFCPVQVITVRSVVRSLNMGSLSIFDGVSAGSDSAFDVPPE